MRIWSGLHLNPISIKLSQLQGVNLPIALGIVLDPFHCSMEYTEDEVILEKKRPWLYPSCYQLQNLTPFNFLPQHATGRLQQGFSNFDMACHLLHNPACEQCLLRLCTRGTGLSVSCLEFCAALLFLPLSRNCRHCCEYGVSALILADNHKVTLLSCCPGVRKTISYPALPLQSVSNTNLFFGM